MSCGLYNEYLMFVDCLSFILISIVPDFNSDFCFFFFFCFFIYFCGNQYYAIIYGFNKRCIHVSILLMNPLLPPSKFLIVKIKLPSYVFSMNLLFHLKMSH